MGAQTSSSLTVRGRGTNASTGDPGGAGKGSGTGGLGSSRMRGGPVGRLSARIAGIENRLLRQELGARANQISFTSLVDGQALEARTLLGELKMRIGTQTDGRMAVVYRNGPPPPLPTTPLVSARQLSMVIGWDGEFTPDGEETTERPSDLSRVDVHISTDPEFVPTAATVYASLLTESATSVFADIQDWYVRLVAVTTSDVPSAATEAVKVRPLPASQIAAGVIAAEQFAGEIYLGSTFYAGEPDGAHAEFNASGLRLTRSDGVTPTVIFSTEEGNAIITGTIQTAPPDAGVARIVFNPFPEDNYNAIRFYNPAGDTWSTLAAGYGMDGSQGAVQLAGPLSVSNTRTSVALLAQDSATLGIVDLNAGTITDGLSVADDVQQLSGNSMGFVFNYKTNEPTAPYYDPFFAWVDSMSSNFHTDSLLQLSEAVDSANANKRHPVFRCAGNNTALHLWDAGLSVTTYAGSAYVNVYALNTSSSIEGKTDVVDLDAVLDGDARPTALGVLDAVAPRRFSRLVDDQPGEVDLPAPAVSPGALSAMSADQRRQVPAEAVTVPRRVSDPEFGLVAEDLLAVAPEAVMTAPNGDLHVNTTALIGVLWGGMRALTAKVDAIGGADVQS